MKIEIGQKWKEGDKRLNRVVEVIGFTYDNKKVLVYCEKSKRYTLNKASRFNGGSRGYTLVKEAK